MDGDDAHLEHALRSVVMDDDGLGPDFSGIRAHAALELHVRECTERQAETRANFSAIHGRLDRIETAFDHRMVAMNNRLWAAAVGIIGILLSITGVLVAYVFLRAH